MEENIIIRQWKDPLGRTIVLTLGRWNGHVLLRHPEMEHLLDRVGETIESPEMIFKEKDTRLYYGLLSSNKIIKVVVRVLSETGGFVKTAHIFRGRKDARGEIEWTGI